MKQRVLGFILILICIVLLCMLLLIVCSSLHKVLVTECPVCGRLDSWIDTIDSIHICESCGAVYKPVVLWVEFIEL